LQSLEGVNAVNIIREPVLRELVRSPVPVRAVVRGAQNGFLVVAQVAGQEKVLETARGGIRRFASLDTAASFVSDLGLPVFEVDMSGYQPGRLRKARPDRAEALKRTRTHMQQQQLKGLE